MHRFFLSKQQEDKSLTHYEVAIQNLWRHLEKRDVGCADITDSEHILRDQFITVLKASSVWRALQEKVKAQPTSSFDNAEVDVVAQNQKEADATVAVTKKFEPAYLKEEALAPSPLSAMQTVLTKLAQDVATLKQEVASFKKDSPQPPSGENPLSRDPEKRQKMLVVWSLWTHIQELCGGPNSRNPYRSSLNH